MNPRSKTEVERTLRAFVVELLVYAVLVTAYFFAVLHFLGGWLVRLETEQALKRGEVDAVLATSSLELGIDIGALDLVVQIDSPGNIAAGLQRVGRAGHLEKATAKGRMIARGPAVDALQLAEHPRFEHGLLEPVHEQVEDVTQYLLELR